MSRVAVCIFFIAIFHNGILKFTQANETTTAGLPKNNEEATVKPTEPVPVTENGAPPSETEATRRKEASGESESSGKSLNDVLKVDPSQHAKILFELPKTILEPVKAVRATIGEVVGKSMDTARELAGGTFNFLRSTVNGMF